ncbi:MAG TPA: GNAT family N-acetyltransferase [Polyangiaceae bacterium]
MSRPILVRAATIGDLEAVARSFHALWPEGSLVEHRADAEAILRGAPPSSLPLVVLVATDGEDGEILGVIEVGLRSHADGCDARHPVGFIEGWYVEPAHRARGVGRALMRAAEDWSKAQGCREVASDTWADHEPSQRAHEALGFEVVDRCVHFRKALA